MPAKPRERPWVIAVIGCDGAGKSTVSQHVLDWMNRRGPAQLAHLGKQSGNIGRALARLPLIGGWFGRTIKRKAGNVRHDFARATQPGLLTALVISAFTLRRLHRFRRMLALRRRGFSIVTDRYPQTAIAGAYDGPGLPQDAPGSRLVRWLARREHAKFAWMASHQPDLVLRLNVDLDTARARKPDHDPEVLRIKIAATPRLTFGGAPIVDIDARQPLAEVIAAAEAAVARRIAAARDAGRPQPDNGVAQAP